MLELKDIKKGNLVECLEDYGNTFTEGNIYEIANIDVNWLGACILKSANGLLYGVPKHKFKLHKPKEDLRDLLKVGYKIAFIPFMGAYKMEVLDSETLKIVKEDCDCCLIDKMIHSMKINEIYKPCECGNDWILVWKREEERFTLRLAGNVRLPYYAHGNCKTRYDYTFRKSSKSVNEEKYQVAFTEAEIKKLPNQELINGLIKEPVKNETV